LRKTKSSQIQKQTVWGVCFGGPPLAAPTIPSPSSWQVGVARHGQGLGRPRPLDVQPLPDSRTASREAAAPPRQGMSLRIIPLRTCHFALASNPIDETLSLSLAQIAQDACSTATGFAGEFFSVGVQRGVSSLNLTEIERSAEERVLKTQETLGTESWASSFFPSPLAGSIGCELRGGSVEAEEIRDAEGPEEVRCPACSAQQLGLDESMSVCMPCIKDGGNPRGPVACRQASSGRKGGRSNFSRRQQSAKFLTMHDPCECAGPWQGQERGGEAQGGREGPSGRKGQVGPCICSASRLAQYLAFLTYVRTCVRACVRACVRSLCAFLISFTGGTCLLVFNNKAPAGQLQYLRRWDS
jgi:hypothetical protein